MNAHDCKRMLSRLCVAAAVLLAACSDSDTQPVELGSPNGRLVSQYFAIFNDGTDDNFSAALDLHPPFELWDITMIAFLHTTKKDGVYVAAYENARGLDPQERPIPPAPGDTDKDRIRRLKQAALAVNPQMKFVISLGWGRSDFSNGAKNPAEFARSVGQIVEENDLDGFDVDFESDRIEESDFRTVSQALRTELDARGATLGKRLLLTFTPAELDDVELTTVNEFYDLVQMQSYDYDMDGKFPPSEVVGKGVDSAKILFGRDIEGGDTLSARRYGIPNAATYVKNKGLAGFMSWRVNSASQMKKTPLWSGVKMLHAALQAN